MRCLITGGCGFVGRHLTKRLLADGHDVVVVDSLTSDSARLPDAEWTGRRAHSGAFGFWQGDCREWFQEWLEAPREKRPHYDWVFHLAAVVGGRAMIEGSPIAVAQDLAIDADFWNWAVRAKPGRIVYFSSSAVYPVFYQRFEQQRIQLAESMQGMDPFLVGLPDLTYGWAKLTGEYLARMAHRQYGLQVICFRPFSGYGSDQHDSYPFPALLRRVLRSRQSGDYHIPVWGTGRQVRDFIHIDDCIEGILQLMSAINDGSPVNLCSGVGTSFIELLDLMSEAAGIKTLAIPDTAKPAGVACRIGDPDYMEALGFVPQIGLLEGIRRALRVLELA